VIFVSIGHLLDLCVFFKLVLASILTLQYVQLFVMFVYWWWFIMFLLYYVQCRVSVSRWAELSHLLSALYCCWCWPVSRLSSRYENHGNDCTVVSIVVVVVVVVVVVAVVINDKIILP